MSDWRPARSPRGHELRLANGAAAVRGGRAGGRARRQRRGSTEAPPATHGIVLGVVHQGGLVGGELARAVDDLERQRVEACKRTAAHPHPTVQRVSSHAAPPQQANARVFAAGPWAGPSSRSDLQQRSSARRRSLRKAGGVRVQRKYINTDALGPVRRWQRGCEYAQQARRWRWPTETAAYLAAKTRPSRPALRSRPCPGMSAAHWTGSVVAPGRPRSMGWSGGESKGGSVRGATSCATESRARGRKYALARPRPRPTGRGRGMSGVGQEVRPRYR